MARDVNDSHPLTVRKVEKGKAQLNGDSPLLLLFQAVGVGPGNGFDQGGFAMINMAGGT
jgi:hypothetical protein